MSMFCYQCEQTSKGSACTLTGVCGKDPEVSALQDLLIYACKDISRYAHRAYEAGKHRDDIDQFTVAAIFATLTNTNFDATAIQQFLREAVQVRALAILLTLLYLNVQNIKLGLSLPAFVSPAVWQVLVDKFKISPITNVESDLAEALGK